MNMRNNLTTISNDLRNRDNGSDDPDKEKPEVVELLEIGNNQISYPCNQIHMGNIHNTPYNVMSL